MAPTVFQDISHPDAVLHSAFPRAATVRQRMIVGVTSDQTCLVLRGRLRKLRLAGFDVTLVASPGELLARIAAEEGVTAWPLPMERGISPLSDAISFVGLCWLLLRVRPAIVDFSTPKAGFLGNLAAWMLRVPHRSYTLRGLKLEGTHGVKWRFLLASERLAAWCADAVLCNSTSLRSKARILGIAPEKKLKLLGDGSSNGVDAEHFCPGSSAVRAELGIGEGDPVLGFVGRLTRDKGIPELLVAFEAILRAEPRCWLLLVGWFDDAEDALDLHWRRHIERHPRIRCTGRVSDTAPYYRAMDLFILPTHREGFPNSALEASASGLPVITSLSTGARDAVLPEVTGLLIPPEAPEAICEAVLLLLRDSATRKRYGDSGREWVIEHYSSDRVLALAVEFYRGLLSGESPGDR